MVRFFFQYPAGVRMETRDFPIANLVRELRAAVAEMIRHAGDVSHVRCAHECVWRRRR